LTRRQQQDRLPVDVLLRKLKRDISFALLRGVKSPSEHPTNPLTADPPSASVEDEEELASNAAGLARLH
jgi:hypothetical protein